MADDDESEVPERPSESAPHVSLGYSTPSGWAYPSDPAGVGHAAVGEPADMRKVKAPVDDQPIDLAVPDVPMATEVTVVTGEAG